MNLATNENRVIWKSFPHWWPFLGKPVVHYSGWAFILHLLLAWISILWNRRSIARCFETPSLACEIIVTETRHNLELYITPVICNFIWRNSYCTVAEYAHHLNRLISVLLYSVYTQRLLNDVLIRKHAKPYWFISPSLNTGMYTLKIKVSSRKRGPDKMDDIRRRHFLCISFK